MFTNICIHVHTQSSLWGDMIWKIRHPKHLTWWYDGPEGILRQGTYVTGQNITARDITAGYVRQGSILRLDISLRQGKLWQGILRQCILLQGIRRHLGMGNSHISTPERRKSRSTIAFEKFSASSAHCIPSVLQKTHHISDKNICVHKYIGIPLS